MKVESIDVKDNNKYRAILKSDEKFKQNILDIIITIVLLVMSSILIKSILNSGNLYNFLNKPRFAPNFKMAYIILNLLYILIGVSNALMIFKPDKKKQIKNKNKILFMINILFTLIVPLVYFRFKLRMLGVIILSLQAIFISYNIVEDYKVSNVAGLIKIPYLLYLVFMTYILMYAKVLIN